MSDSLSSGRKIVTWILTGAIMPVEMEAGVVRFHLLNVTNLATRSNWRIAEIWRRRAAIRSCSMKTEHGLSVHHVVAINLSHIDISAGDED